MDKRFAVRACYKNDFNINAVQRSMDSLCGLKTQHNIYIYEDVAAPWLLRSRNYIGPLTEAEIEIYIKKKQEFKLFVNGF